MNNGSPKLPQGFFLREFLFPLYKIAVIMAGLWLLPITFLLAGVMDWTIEDSRFVTFLLTITIIANLFLGLYLASKQVRQNTVSSKKITILATIWAVGTLLYTGFYLLSFIQVISSGDQSSSYHVESAFAWLPFVFSGGVLLCGFLFILPLLFSRKKRAPHAEGS